MLNVPDAPAFVPHAVAIVVGAGFAVHAIVFFFLRAARPRHEHYEFRIVSVFMLLVVGVFMLLVDATLYNTNHGDAARLSAEIERVYGIEVGSSAAQLLWDGKSADVDGTTYLLVDDRLETAEGWIDVPVP